MGLGCCLRFALVDLVSGGLFVCLLVVLTVLF